MRMSLGVLSGGGAILSLGSGVRVSRTAKGAVTGRRCRRVGSKRVPRCQSALGGHLAGVGARELDKAAACEIHGGPRTGRLYKRAETTSLVIRGATHAFALC